MAETSPIKQPNHSKKGPPGLELFKEPVPRYDSILAQLIDPDPTNPASPLADLALAKVP